MAVRPEFMAMRLGGASILERQLHALSQAGFSRVWVSARQPEPGVLGSVRLPKGLEIFWAGAQGGKSCDPPYVSVSGDYLVSADILRTMRRRAAGKQAGFCYADGEGSTVAQFFPKLPDLLHNTPRRTSETAPPQSYVALQLPPGDREASEWIFKSAVRPNDGFMARHFDRKISLWITRRLVKFGTPPSLMTLASLAVGLAGAACFLFPGRGWAVLGAVLVWTHSILDGCDGELARVSMRESAFGRWLDYWSDSLVHVSLFGCLGVGLFWQGRPWSRELAASAIFSTIVAALAVYARRAAPDTALPSRGLARLRVYLEQRDFIYVLVIMAALGMSYEFLWLAAAGTAFFLLILFLAPSGDLEDENGTQH